MIRHPLRLLPVLVAGAFSASAFASGFQLLEQNASGLGNAYAGSAAVAENASTVFFNPAGMQLLDGRQVSLGLVAISPHYQFNNNGSTIPGALGGTAASSNTVDAGHLGLVPDAFIAWPLTKDVTVGLGVSAPFGLKTEYPVESNYLNGWAGQYQSDKFEIRTTNVNPSISWQASEKLSLGFGVDYQKISAQYVKMKVLPVLLGGPALATVNLNDTAWGWNAGALYKFSDNLRVGLSYRSDVGYNATGTSVAGPLSGTASANVRLPATWVLSTWQKLDDRWEMMGDISYTKWSSIQQLVIQSQTQAGASSDTLDLQFKNTWRAAFGGSYKYSDSWKFRFGLAWDQTPVPSDTLRPASLPDNDRWWLSVGAQFRPNATSTLDVGYAHLFLRSPAIANDGSGNSATKGLVQGTYSDSANILGMQYSQKF